MYSGRGSKLPLSSEGDRQLAAALSVHVSYASTLSSTSASFPSRPFQTNKTSKQ